MHFKLINCSRLPGRSLGRLRRPPPPPALQYPPSPSFPRRRRRRPSMLTAAAGRTRPALSFPPLPGWPTSFCRRSAMCTPGFRALCVAAASIWYAAIDEDITTGRVLQRAVHDRARHHPSRGGSWVPALPRLDGAGAPTHLVAGFVEAPPWSDAASSPWSAAAWLAVANLWRSDVRRWCLLCGTGGAAAGTSSAQIWRGASRAGWILWDLTCGGL